MTMVVVVVFSRRTHTVAANFRRADISRNVEKPYSGYAAAAAAAANVTTS